MKIEWLVAGVTPIGLPGRAERHIFGMLLDFFAQFSPLLWSGSYFEIYESSLEP